MTPRQERFADIVAGQPGIAKAEAARRAGYALKCAARSGHRLANDPVIIAAIQVKRETRRQMIQAASSIRHTAIANGDAAAALEALRIELEMSE